MFNTLELSNNNDYVGWISADTRPLDLKKMNITFKTDGARKNQTS